MPTTYAIMGATGSTGTAILRSLQANPPEDLHLNIYVRDKVSSHPHIPTPLFLTPSFSCNFLSSALPITFQPTH
jgi:hypothetical protein